MSITSPTLSSLSDDSFHRLSSSVSTVQSFSDLDASSDDEIVWTVSDVDLSASEASLSGSSNVVLALDNEDEDFVLLSRNNASQRRAVDTATPNPQNRALTPDDSLSGSLSQGMRQLHIEDDASSLGSPRSIKSEPRSEDTSLSSPRKRSPRRRKARTPTPCSPASQPPSSPPPSKKRNKKSSRSKGLGTRGIVDDCSEQASELGDNVSEVDSYQSAVTFIDRFLSDQTEKDMTTRLIFLQSLIIELGLATAYSSLPASLKAARAFLKARVFLNIRDYLRVRNQGVDALQKVMFPSKSALVRDIRKNHTQAPLKHVKQSGLQVLLVPCYHHR